MALNKVFLNKVSLKSIYDRYTYTTGDTLAECLVDGYFEGAPFDLSSPTNPIVEIDARDGDTITAIRLSDYVAVGVPQKDVATTPANARYNASQFGITSESTAAEVQAVLELGFPIRLDSPTFKSGVVLSNTSVDLELTGNIDIDYTDNPDGFTPIQINVDFLDMQNVTAVSTVSYDFGGGNTTVTRLTVEDADAYAKNDVVKIISQDQIPWLDATKQQKMGSSHVVGAINSGSNYVYLLDTVYQSFATSIRVAKYNKDVKIKITGDAVFKHLTDHTDDERRETISIKGAYKPVVKDVKAENLTGEFVGFTGCWHAYTNNVSGENLETDAANDQYGYVVVERNCSHGEHHAPNGQMVRHVWTNGASFSPVVDDFASYGCNEYANVYDLVGINCTNAGEDTHPGSYYTTFHDSATFNPFRGTDGAAWSSQLRGVGDLVINHTAFGGDGVVIRNVLDGTKDCIVRGFNYYPRVGEPILAPVRVEGVSGYRITGVVLDDIRINGAIASLSAVNCEYADVEIINSHIATVMNSDSKPLYRAVDATIKVRGGSTDFTGSAALNTRFSKLSDSTSSIDVRNHEITLGGASVNVLTDFSSLNGTAFFKDIDMDAAPSASDIANNRGGSSVFNASFTINGGLGGRKNYYTTSKSAGFSLNGTRIEENTTDSIIVVVTMTGAAGTSNLSDIPAGRMLGQKLTIMNHNTSTKTIQIQKAGNIGVSAATDLLAGDSHTLVWNGSKWAG
jgi:hypothetical protein